MRSSAPLRPRAALSSNPRDGQLELLAATHPTPPTITTGYFSEGLWQMRYSASSGFWVFEGGCPIFVRANDSFSTVPTYTTAQDASDGPWVDLIHGGQYQARWGAGASGTNVYSNVSLYGGATPTVTALAFSDIIYGYGYGGEAYYSVQYEGVATLAAGQRIRHRYNSTSAAQTSYVRRTLSMLPVYLT